MKSRKVSAKKGRVPKHGAGIPPALATAAAVALLLVSVAVIYARTVNFAFIKGDDTIMVAEHSVISRGLSWQGISWAFCNALYGIWMPLTALTHMADVTVFGSWAGGHHLVSVLWHAITVLMFYAALRALTGARGASLLAASLFAVHPLCVEDVAWISSRKDLVAGFFFASALLAHVWYTRRPEWPRYMVLLAAGMLALAGKTSAAPLPGLLLLLDFWPLRRFRADGDTGEPVRCALRLVAEKIPLLLMGVVVSLVTWNAQLALGVTAEKHGPPAAQRMAGIAYGYLHYLVTFLCPVGLEQQYPFPPFILWKTAIAWCLVLALSVAAFALYRRAPWLTVGWFWFLAALLPVSGVIPYGVVPYADRYMYIPCMGLCMATAWTVTALPFPQRPRAMLCAVLVLLLAGLSWRQTGAWREFWSFHERKLAAYPNDPEVQSAAAQWLSSQGDLVGAVRYDREAVRLAPDSGQYCYNLGTDLMADSPQEAVQWLEKATRLSPEFSGAWANLGVTLIKLKRPQDALSPLREAARIDPKNPVPLVNLGVALINLNQHEEALAPLREAVRLDPNNAVSHVNLGVALMHTGNMGEGRAAFEKALALDPQNQAARSILQQQGP